MNLTSIGISAMLALGIITAAYVSGYREGKADLLSEQRIAGEQKLAKQTQRQQQTETVAAATDAEGKQTTEVIYRDVIKYVKTPGRNVCTFDDARVLLKRRAAENANHLSGPDATPVQN